jgi:hypothetical protein
MRRTKYVQDVMARTGLSGNRILAAIAVQAECILEIQHLCIAGWSTINGICGTCQNICNKRSLTRLTLDKNLLS